MRLTNYNARIRQALPFLFLIASGESLPAQWLSAIVEEDGFITIVRNSTPAPADNVGFTEDGAVRAVGIDFQSANGNLVPLPDRDFFEPNTSFPLLLSNTTHQVTYAHLDGFTVISDRFETGVAYAGDLLTNDLTLDWGIRGSVGLLPIWLEGQEIGEQPNNADPPVEPLAVQPPTVTPAVVAPHLVGTFPEGGGPISVEAIGGDVHTLGLDFISPSGGLIPAVDSSPFGFYLANTPIQVTYGNLGVETTFMEGSTTELSVGVAAGTDDIEAAWGTDTPVSFSVSSGPALDNEDNLLGGDGSNDESGGTENPIDTGSDPTMLPTTPAAVPEPSSLLVWITLGTIVAWCRRKPAMDAG